MTSLDMTTADATRSAVERFNRAVNEHDLDALAAAITEDCFFESTLPPDGDAHRGTAAITAFFRKLFESAGGRTFDTEEVVVAGDRAVVRWVHRWTDAAGTEGHVRGIDLFRARDGKIAEKLSYVKG